MEFRIILFSICFLFLGHSVNGQSTTQNKRIQADPSKHPVSRLYLSTIEAFNAGNLEGFLSNFSSEIKMYGTVGMYNGKDALRARFQAIFQQFPKSRMEIPALSLEILGDKTVLVHFKWKLFPMGQGPAYSGDGSGLYVLKEDKWEEVLEVETVREVDDALRQNSGN